MKTIARIVGMMCMLVACGGTVAEPLPDAGTDACAVWYDPAGGECVDTCTHQPVTCPEDAGAE